CKLLSSFSVTISRSSPQAAPDGVSLALTFDHRQFAHNSPPGTLPTEDEQECRNPTKSRIDLIAVA
ncbi:hypothetical protein NKJ46_32080, partial [Mesorhizobium sp. M0166]|uniref:hypothetical protein n=1 Tax=Mesorhizobium sp. M0166 TaxID=2956902 RepID=UPI00333787C6